MSTKVMAPILGVPIPIGDDWNVSYSPYIDDLSLADRSLAGIRGSQLIRKPLTRDTSVVFDKATNDIVMVRIDRASSHLGEIDDLDKHDIINRVKEYIYAEGKQYYKS